MLAPKSRGECCFRISHSAQQIKPCGWTGAPGLPFRRHIRLAGDWYYCCAPTVNCAGLQTIPYATKPRPRCGRLRALTLYVHMILCCVFIARRYLTEFARTLHDMTAPEQARRSIPANYFLQGGYMLALSSELQEESRPAGVRQVAGLMIKNALDAEVRCVGVSTLVCLSKSGTGAARGSTRFEKASKPRISSTCNCRTPARRMHCTSGGSPCLYPNGME